MKRLLLTLGPVTSLLGAVGLFLSGGAIIGMFGTTLSFRVSDPPEPLLSTLTELGWAAVSGMALAVGCAVSSIAIAMRDSQHSLSRVGKMLGVTAGVLLLIGTFPLLGAILSAKASFQVIATSASTPKAEDIQEMVEATAPKIRIGAGILIAAAAVMVLVAAAGFLPAASRATQGLRIGVMAAITSLVMSVVALLLFLFVWRHGDAIEALLLNTTAVKPAELAGNLSEILNKSLLAFLVIGCQGIAQVLVTVFPAAAQDART